MRGTSSADDMQSSQLDIVIQKQEILSLLDEPRGYNSLASLGDPETLEVFWRLCIVNRRRPGLRGVT